MAVARDLQLGVAVSKGSQEAWDVVIASGVRQTGASVEAYDKSSNSFASYPTSSTGLTGYDTSATSSPTYIRNMVDVDGTGSSTTDIEKSSPQQSVALSEVISDVARSTTEKRIENNRIKAGFDSNDKNTGTPHTKDLDNESKNTKSYSSHDTSATSSNDKAIATKAFEPKPTEDVASVKNHAPVRSPEVVNTADLPKSGYSDPVVMSETTSISTEYSTVLSSHPAQGKKKKSLWDQFSDAVTDGFDGLGEFFTEAYHVVNGDEAAAREKLKDQKEKLKSMRDDTKVEMDKLQARRDRLEFFPEIFVMATTNKLNFTYAKDLAEYNIEADRYTELADAYKSDYEMMLDQTKTFLGKILWGVIKIVGGLGRDLFNAVFKLDWDAFLRILHVVVDVVFIAVAIATGQVWAAVLLVMDLIELLDTTYADGLISMAVMQALDFLFNQVLNLDSEIPWFHRFNEDSKYYMETLMYLQLIIKVGGIIAKLYVAPDVSAYLGKAIAVEIGTTVQKVKEIAELGYSGYTTYAAIKAAREQYVDANEAYDKLKKELSDKRDNAQKRYIEARARKMRRAFTEADMFISGTAIVIAGNVASCNSDVTNAYNPVARIPYDFEKETTCSNDGTNFDYEQFLQPVSYKDY